MTLRTCVALAVAASLAASCKKQRTNAIAVVAEGDTQEFWRAVQAGARKAANELGVDILWKAPARHGDSDEQVEILERLIGMRVNGIIVAPLDVRALGPALADASRAKIPVVLLAAAREQPGTVSLVGTDDYLAGRRATDQMAKLVGNKGAVTVFRHAQGSDSARLREDGFVEALRMYPETKLVPSDPFTSAQDLLGALGGPGGGLAAQGIFCPSESTALGLARALEARGQAGKVKVVGFDSSAELVAAMRKGTIDATVVRDPIHIGYTAVRTMVEHLQGRPVEKRIDTGATIITRIGMNEPQARELLSPDYAKWLEATR